MKLLPKNTRVNREDSLGHGMDAVIMLGLFFLAGWGLDSVFGTMNHYGNVDMFAGRFNEAYRKAEVDYNENFAHDDLLETFKAMLADWTNE